MNNAKRIRLIPLALAALSSLAAFAAQAGVADTAVHAKAAGIDLIVYPMGVKDVVTFTGSMPLGDAFLAAKADNPAVPTLTAMLLEAGTTHRDKFAISDTLDGIGAQLSFSPSAARIGIYGKSLKQDLPTVLDLLAEQLREPAFTAEELAKAKVQLEAALRQASDNPGAMARETMMLSVFPAGSINAPAPREAMLKAVPQVTLEQIKAFHAKYYGPAHMTLVFAGDVDARAIETAVAHGFNGWSGGVDYLRDAPARLPAKAAEHSIAMKDKASVSVFLGQATGLRYTDADYLPMTVGVDVLGSGFTGRLMAAVRAKEGLTYGIGGNLLGSDYMDGGLGISTTFAPELMDKGIASTRRELQRWWKDGITAEELDARKQAMVGSYQVGLGNTDGMSAAIIGTVERGVGLAWLDNYPQAIQSVTLQQVNGVIRKYVDPQKMVLVKAGTFKK
ncbi:pitrilysin family protein [Stenotrophomonas sp.]|uniref:M16 family metallopeptidase n=1 Tax=Stenotrophomonas sp. TaxID=69392 RepID=UPI0028AB7318|nr:pitrilysin family protein [Stenotrophomonas sp.]